LCPVLTLGTRSLLECHADDSVSMTFHPDDDTVSLGR
jgi:hypothetical protein